MAVKSTDAIRLILGIVYFEEKAERLRRLKKDVLEDIVIKDLELLTVSTPPSKINEMNGQHIGLFWDTTRHSDVYTSVSTAVDQYNPDSIHNWKNTLSIKKLSMTTVPSSSSEDAGLTTQENSPLRPKLRQGATISVKSESEESVVSHAATEQRERPSAPQERTPKEGKADLYRQFWDTRRNITASAVEGARLESYLELEPRPHKDLLATLADLEAQIQEERRKRTMIERILSDIKEECAHPQIIPLLLGSTKHT